MPKRSLHLASFSDDLVHALHFDAEHDEIFEHQLFDKENNFKMYDIPTPPGKNHSRLYKPIQTRFHKDQIRPEAAETRSQLPEIWPEN